MSNQNENFPQIPSRKSWLVVTCLAIICVVWLIYAFAVGEMPVQQRWSLGFTCTLMTAATTAVLLIDYKKA